jgi:hypothetical protein
MNPVRAKLVKDPTHWTWSSAFAHANGGEDKLRENTIFNSIGKYRNLQTHFTSS